jgi:glycolate oxidase FAD binding subunit
VTTTTNIADHLAAITGPDQVRPGDPITVSPANTNEVSAILRYANENKLTVTPTGGNTKQSWGNPVAANIRLDLTRLNRVIEHPWQDLTATVQAGCTWVTLQQTLAQHNQFVALDPLWPERATVGGILSTNDSGSLRHKYGSLRDLVIGMTLVLADGTIARSGGKVVKNVAGYDLCKLVTGSHGTLAIITEATFRLHPVPQHPQTFTIAAPQAAQLATLMATIRASHLLTQALQLRGDSHGFHLDIQLNAHPEAHQDDILKKMTEAAGLKLEQASDEVRLARESLFANPGCIVKATMLPESITKSAEEVSRLGGTSVSQALGIMYAYFPRPTERPIADLYKFLQASQIGSFIVFADFDLSAEELMTPWSDKSLLPLMQSVKKQFDPNNTLRSIP